MNMSDGQQVRNACPSREELKAFYQGRLTEAALNRFAEHVESPCPQCVAALQELEDQVDPLLADLRRSPPLSSAESEEACQWVLNHVPAPGAPAPSPAPTRPSGPPMVGTRFGHYDLLEVLGRGGMGVVYKARHVELEKIVALKVIRPDKLANLSEEQRREWIDCFRIEGKLVASLDSVHIVPARDFGEHGGQPFFVMDYMDGGKLEARIGKVDPREAARLVAAVAKGVHYAHQHGSVHLDLKPGNVLLDAHRQPRVADFGLAKRRDPAAGGNTSVGGTPEYMAPEQAELFLYLDRGGTESDTTKRLQERITVQTDVYSLGAVLYACLTGRPPFRAETTEDTLKLVIDPGVLPAPPRTLNSRVDPELQAVCLKCLDKNPERRYRSAEELAEDLENWRDGRETKALPWSRPYRRWRWCRSNPLGVALALVALSLVGLLGWHLAEALQEPVRAQETLARHQARTVHLRLAQLSDGVGATARDPQLELGALLNREDREGLEKALVQASRQRVDMNGVSPFENWFILNLNGNLLASSTLMEPRPEGVDLRQRDYFQGALRLADQKGGSPVYISRVYQSVLRADKRYKFGVSAAVRHGDTIVGVLVATVTTSRKMGLPDIEGEESATALLMQKDPWTLPEETPPPEGASPYLVLLHPAYEQRGSEPVWFPNEQLPEVQAGASDRYRDPVGAVDQTYQGRWLAAFAPVADANYVVVVQRRYTPAIPGYWYPLLGSVLAILLTVTVVEYLRRRRRASTTSTVQSTASFLATQPRDR